MSVLSLNISDRDAPTHFPSPSRTSPVSGFFKRPVFARCPRSHEASPHSFLHVLSGRTHLSLCGQPLGKKKFSERLKGARHLHRDMEIDMIQYGQQFKYSLQPLNNKGIHTQNKKYRSVLHRFKGSVTKFKR
ncbi:hypothetical protein BgiBS90_005484 [Biomphalaria glabrata]|nr:hypothetical protein BgiBS90_005484 [Biomphalaria glabrata]